MYKIKVDITRTRKGFSTERSDKLQSTCINIGDEKQEWKREKEELLLKQITVSPSQNKETSIDELVKTMSQINLNMVK